MNAKLNEKLDRTYMLDILRRLLETPSPSGFCMNIMEMVQAEAKRLGYAMELTPKGNGLLSVEGEAQGEHAAADRACGYAWRDGALGEAQRHAPHYAYRRVRDANG